MIFLFLACSGNSDSSSKAAVFSEGNLRSDIANYLDWAQPGGWAGQVISCATAHGPLVDIWYNDIAFQALGRNDAVLPDGSALVLQSYLNDGSPEKMVAMRKASDFAPDQGDWFWGEFSSDGTALASGALSSCADCHVTGHDYVQFPDAPRVQDFANCP